MPLYSGVSVAARAVLTSQKAATANRSATTVMVVRSVLFHGLGVGVMARSISRVIDWNAASFSGPVTCVTIRPRRFMT